MAAGVLVVAAGAVFVTMKWVGPGEGAQPDGGRTTDSPNTVAPVAFSRQLEKDILTLPALQPEYADAARTQVGFRATGKLDMVQQTARADGTHVLRVWAEVQRPGMNGQLQNESVLLEVWLDAAGKPILDFAAADEFFRAAKEAGFTRPLNGYGGPGVSGLHDGYVIGETGRKWEKQTGKPMGELLALVWGAVRDHAKEQGWLDVQVGMTDEPRVLDQVKAQVELMKLYAHHAPWVNIGGSYSVHWDKNDPVEAGIREIFMTLKWSALNLHTQVDLDKAKEFGKELYIYNQGRTRYSFGAYQWAEMHKGVRGRLQWHLAALHGYQFFDLDGREPDTAVIRWGRAGILPTMSLPRCREGADDLRFAATLWNLAQKKKGTPAGDEAIAFLEGVSAQIGLNKNERPAGFMADEAFREECIARIVKLRG